MVLKDVVCDECSSASEDFLAGDASATKKHCGQCGRMTLHTAKLGGTHSRWRFCDFGGYDPTGGVEYLGATATDAAGNAIAESDGSKTDGAYSSGGRRAGERRERKNHKPKLYF